MKKERGGQADAGGGTRPIPTVPSQQEGSVESVGGGPAGKDDGDRSGDGTLPAEATSPAERGRDAFLSSEVSDKSSVPGKDPRTRS
jgi:hypothetical protein